MQQPADGAPGELSSARRRLEEARARAAALQHGLDGAQGSWRPSPRHWSIADCLDHLHRSGNQFLPRIEQAIRDGTIQGMRGRGPFRHGAIGNLMVRMAGDAELPPRRRFRAPAFARPSGDVPLAEAYPAFIALQDRLAAAVNEAEGLDLARVKAAAPVPLLRFSLGQWFAMLTGHQLRHLWQAEQVRVHPLFPT